MSEILDDFPEDQLPKIKERHGCVTAWLVLMIIANSIASLSNLFFSDQIMMTLPDASVALLWALGGLGVLNIVFAFMLFQWKKMGFYGFLVTSFLGLIINLMVGIEPFQALTGMAGIVILYGILQIRANDGRTAWELSLIHI